LGRWPTRLGALLLAGGSCVARPRRPSFRICWGDPWRSRPAAAHCIAGAEHHRDDLRAGRGEWLVGVTAICDYPAPARTLPKVGGIAAPNLEQIVRLRPDLVFATAEGNSRDLLDQLERLGLATFALRPDSYGGVIESIRAVGRAVAADPAARRIVDDMGRRVRAVQELVAGRSRPVSSI